MSNEIARLFVTLGAETKDFTKGMQGALSTMNKTGKIMMGVGGAMTAGFIAAAQAANVERVGISRLSQTLKNVGVEYDSVKESLEDVILATQRKTGIADDEQREALNSLLITTNDYNKSLSLLPLVLDLAAAKNIDLKTSAELVGKVAEGNLGVLSRYGIVLGEGATAAEALDAIQKRVAGSAEAVADPMKILQARIGDISEAIGGALLGDFDKTIRKIEDITNRIVKWIEINPELVRTLAAVGLTILAAGGVLFAISQVSKAIVAVNTALAIMQALSGPKGWITLAAGVLIAGGTIWGLNELMNKSVEGIPSYASGGVVTSPTLAMVGDAPGGEAIIPLNQLSGGENQEINLYLDGEQITTVVERRMNNRIRLQEVTSY